jgi:hypothetical protein
MTDAAGVVDLQASANAASGMATYPVEMSQGMLGKHYEQAYQAIDEVSQP